MQLTHKTVLACGKPYNTLSGEEYLALLRKSERAIYEGTFGIYLARRVIVENQELYQPLIDIDGATGLEGTDKTSSAIQFASATMNVISNLGAVSHFKIIATGGTGFRAVSNLLLNHSAYLAFIDWMRFELPHIHDLKPSTETDIPHQVFAYKGDPLQAAKGLTDGHSTIIDKSMLAQSAFSPDDYLNATAGRPDPDEVISVVQWLINGPVISDLKAIGMLGERIEQYQRIASDVSVSPFSYAQLRKDMEPIGLGAMQDMIAERGIISKVEKRGEAQAISFRGRPCPVCGNPTANARAYPPSYQLKCFNVNCEANNGMPLHRWAGIKSKGGSYKSSKNGFDLSVPDQYISIYDARSLIVHELNARDDALIVVTPGVGKTYAALEAISKIGKDRIVIYGAYNRDLQKEAYDKVCEMAGQSDGFYLLAPRDQSCQRLFELKDITDRGFSPSEILCADCEHRDTGCEYYSQRRDFGPGVYFVTLHMLPYLPDQIPTPDLIILDENLKAGLMLEEPCSELQIKSVLKVVNDTDATIIKHLLNIIQQISTQLVDTGDHSMIINARKLTEASNQETTIVELLAKSMNMIDEDVMDSLDSLSKSLDDLSRVNLYRREIDMKAISWIKGLLSPSTLSFVRIERNGDVRYSTKRITPIGFHDTPIKILDATGDAKAYSALIGRKLKTVRADVAWNSNRVHIKKSLRRTDMSISKKPELKTLLIDMLSHTEAQQIMVVTYMRHEKQIVDILKEIDPTRNFMGHHFMGPRGINSYQACDAVLVIGLPYPNLNSAAQDACILFPSAKDADKRMEWTEACMQWELVQSIHRIRPVRKSCVDVILAANRWPSILPEPQVIIDRSQNTNWKEMAIRRLKPFVEEFGFLNQDIGFLANVYVKKKVDIAKQFQGNMARLILEAASLIHELEGQFITGQLFGSEEINSSEYTCFKDDVVLPTDEKIKLIKALNIIKAKIHLRSKTFYIRLVNLIQKQSGEWTNTDIILSNTKQWTDLLIHFKSVNSHFEKFKIKLPHARGNAVSGVGNPDRVRDFYQQINGLGIVGKIDVESYKTTEQSVCQVNPIPGGFVSIYVPDNEDMAFLGWGSEFKTISLRQGPELLRSFFEDLLADPQTKIITNNGKAIAKVFLECGLPRCEIIDVVISEKLIANGEVAYRCLDLKTVFKRHSLPEDLERSSVVRRLVEVWEKQAALIDTGGLGAVFDLESKVIWVTGKIESAGIEIDVDALVRRHDWLTARLHAVNALLRKTIPDDINLDDRTAIKAYLNSTYALSLAKIDEEAVRSISNAVAADLIRHLLDYWKTSRKRMNVELYMSLTGPDYRARDSIDQLNTKTGRFYRQLQTVEKGGTMRSLFKAREGFKFVVADYSQQEARIIAGLSSDQTAIDLFKAGKDIYLETAKLLLGNQAEGEWHRALGKEIVLGLNNGRAAYSIHECLARMGFGYDLDDVMGMILRYDMAFPEILAWRDAIVKSAHENGFIATKLGRTLKVSRDTNENSLYNYPVQGTAADGFKRALLELDGQLAGLDARIVHILHDEVIVEAKEGIVDTVEGIVKECMEEAFKKSLPAVPFVVKSQVKERWS